MADRISATTEICVGTATIYGNVVSYAWDDLIQTEGAGMNIRIYENYTEYGLVSVSKCAGLDRADVRVPKRSNQGNPHTGLTTVARARLTRVTASPWMALSRALTLAVVACTTFTTLPIRRLRETPFAPC